MKKNPVLGVFILLIFATLASAGDAARLKMDLSTGEFYVNMPKSGVDTLNISADDFANGNGVTSFKLYDDGGKDKPYSYKPNGTLHIVVPEGYFLQVMGLMNAYNADLGIYEGELCQIHSYSKTDDCYNAVNILYRGYSNYALKDVFARSSDNSVSINFYDDDGSGLNGLFGLDLTVQIISKSTEYTITCAENVVGGSCPESKKAKYQDNVSLTVTPESGYVLADIEVKADDGTPVNVKGGKWYSNNTVSFQMPPSNVTITPKYTNDLSNLYIDITPKYTSDLSNLDIGNSPNDVQEVVIPTGVTIFRAKFNGREAYDRNWKDDVYFWLRIIAPENYLFKIVRGELYDLVNSRSTLSIYQGDNCGDNAVRIGGGYFTTLYSSGENANVLTIDYQSTYSGADDIEFTVSIGNKDADYTVTCAENVVGGTCSENQIAKYGDSVTITPTPADGFVLTGVEIKDVNGNLVDVQGGKWYSNTASFKMPFSNVTVTPKFTDDLSDLYINMPPGSSSKRERMDVVVPPVVTSFKVYDDGGKDGNYKNHANGRLHLVFPEGNIVQVTGRVKTFNYWFDCLTIYDNNNTDNDYGRLYSCQGKNNGAWVNGLDENILVLSSSNDLDFQFYGNAGITDEGIDLKVTYGEKKEHAITCKNEGVVGGSIACPENKNVKAGETVTLTATPEAGYVFTGVEIKDANGKVADLVTGVWGDNNIVSFQMPLSDVTVTPLFTNDLSNFEVSMSFLTKRTVVIPPGVTTFKAYDNGGKDGDYSDYCIDTLVFVAPEGYLLKATGSVNLRSSQSDYDTLLICDGSYCGSTTKRLLTKGGGSENDIELLSSGKEMTIAFRADANTYCCSTNSSGFDFTIDVVESIPHNVICANVSGGAVDACPEKKLKIGQNVTLTAKPDNTVLKGVEIVVKDNAEKAYNVVNMTGGTWYNNTFSFNMPYSDVTVKPVFGMPTNLFVNVPKTGSFDVNVPLGVNSFKVFDDGGVLGNYSASADGFIRLNAPNSNYVFQVTGHMKIENGDALSICEGNSCDGSAVNLIKNGKKEDGDISLLSSGNTLTIKFKSSGASNSNEGFDLTVNVVKKDRYNITCNSVEGGSIRCPANDKINAGKIVTMNAIAKSGYILTGFEARNADGSVLQTVDFPWYSENKEISISMPANDVSMTPKFSKITDLYIDMPTSGTLDINTIPADVTSFHVYDDGGKEGDYSEYMNSTLQLNVPDGKMLVVSGSIEASESSELKIYDGFLADASYVGSSDDVGYATANPVSISFTASSASSMAGFDLVVNVADNVEHAITCGSANGGELTCGKTKAKAGDLVPLTATPAEGYVLSYIEVKDVKKNVVKVQDGKWYSNNVASFKMPLDDVTVTPVFAKAKDLDLYVNMPTNGSNNPLTVYIPKGVTTFKVYDDGGKDGPYSKNKTGRINLSAPDGCMLHVTGSLEADDDIYFEIEDRTTHLTKFASADIDISLNGSKNPYIYFSAYNGSLIGDEAAAGFDLTVTLVDKNDFDFPVSCNLLPYNDGGTFGCDRTTAKPGEIVHFTAVPSGDYKFVALEFDGLDDNEIVDIEFDGNTASFTMPHANTKVRPFFVTDVKDFYVNMPEYYMRKFGVSPELVSFHVYDDGGRIGNYGNNKSGYIQLIAPKGYNFMMSGSASIRTYADCLTVFDGGSDAVKLEDCRNGEFDYNFENALKTSGNILSIYFYSNDFSVSWGFDFTVNLGQDVEHSVACGSAEGGILACEKAKANAGDLINLTATPADGYLLDGVEVKDENQNVVDVKDGKWYSPPSRIASASFTMPLQDVTVTPSFSKLEDLFVYMPTAGIDYPETVYIPEGVNSFKVYSKSGSDAVNQSGSLRLIAPKDYMVLVTGSMQASDNDRLDIGYIKGDLDGYFSTSSVYSGAGSIENANVVLNADQVLYIYYNAGSRNVAPVIDLTVNLVKKSDYDFSIFLCAENTEDGNCPENSKVKGRTPVELTVKPEEGKTLTAVEFSTRDESAVVNDVVLSDNKISFTMPPSDVMLWPIIADKTTGLSVNMPAFGMLQLSVSADVDEFKVYDDGGKDGQYSNNANGLLRLTAPEGSRFMLSGTAFTENNYDYLAIYDGEYDESGDVLYSSSGFSELTPLVSSSNVITIYLGTNSYSAYSGLDLNVRVLKDVDYIDYTVACGSSEGGTLVCSRNKAKPGKKVKVITIPEEGYVFGGVDVLAANGDDVYVEGYNDTTGFFYMPLSNVAVKPIFLKTDELFINMPTTGWEKPLGFYIPEGTTSFKVYDDGGKDGNYTKNQSGRLNLYVPEGYVLQVTGSAEVDDNGGLEIGYVNPRDNSYEEKYIKNGNQSDINVVLDDSERIPYIYFGSDGENTAAGLDLTVTVVSKKDVDYSIACDATVDGGTFSCGKANGKGGDIVKLTANPADGFEFVGVAFVNSSVMDGVTIDGNSASFTMPYSDISVMPIFKDKSMDLFFNMPTSGMVAICLAAGVSSFKVYDDGGELENYSNDVRGYLQLIAPDNYLVQLSGIAVTEQNYDSLTIYEGGIGDFRLVNAKSGTIELNDGNALTNKILTLEFISDYSQNDNGLDFTVNLVKNSEFSVTCVESVEGGTVACDKDKAKAGETVTLTSKPADGYILDGVEIKNSDGHVVKSFAWYSHPRNMVSFKMPISNVTVTPTFTKLTDLSVDIAMTSSNNYSVDSITIPVGVNKFKVHNKCVEKCEDFMTGWMHFDVPENSKILVSGSVKTGDENAKFQLLEKSMNYYYSRNCNLYGAYDNFNCVVDGSESPVFYFGATYSDEYATNLDVSVTLVNLTDYGALSVAWNKDRIEASIDGEYYANDAIDIPNDIEVDKVTLDREFPTDMSGFSTLMLPFDVDATDLEGVKSVIEFNGIFDNDGHDAVGMVYVWCNENIGTSRVALGYADCNKYEGKLKAYTPYMVEMESKTIGFKGGVTLKASRKTSGEPVETGVSKDEWKFQGMLQKKVFTKDETKNGNVWGYAGQDRDGAKIGKYVQFGAGAWINPLRAYLLKSSKKTDGEPQDDSELAPKASFIARRAMESMLDESGRLVVADRTAVAGTETASIGGMEVVIVEQDKDGNAHTTVIGRYDSRTGELRMDFRPKHTYDLKGRRVNEGRKAKGAYYGKNVKK